MERNREFDEEEIQESRGEKQEVPRGWSPSQETIEAIKGTREHPRPTTEHQEDHKSPEPLPENEAGAQHRPSRNASPDGDVQKRDDQAPKVETQAKQEQAETSREMQRRTGASTKFQGDIGEGVALRVATERLNLTPDPRFDQRAHGVDGVYLDAKGKPVVIESKFDERGIRALRGDQMQPEWVERNARMMQDPDSERFTPGNAEIGAELLKAGPDKVRRLVITTDPRTLEVRVYEGQSDRSWKQIDTWNAWELEQPYLKN